VLFRSTSDTIVAGMLLSLVYLKAIQWLAPFKDPALNRIKETSIWQIFFVFQIALLIKMDDVDRDLLTACLLFVFFVNFFLMLGQYLLQYGDVCTPTSLSGDAGIEMEKCVSVLSVSMSAAKDHRDSDDRSSRDDNQKHNVLDVDVDAHRQHTQSPLHAETPA
jgi:hypothetical protein